MKTEDATAAVLTHDLARFAPIRVVYRIDPETEQIEGFVEESFSMNRSKTHIRVWWSGKAYSILGEHFINGVEDAEQYVKDGYISVDPLTDECPIEIDWAAWRAATSKYYKRNAPFKAKNKP